MHLLLDDSLAPLTSCIGFLETDCGRAANEYEAWMGPILAKFGAKLVRKPIRGDLITVLLALTPLCSTFSTRIAFVPTDSRWCAFFGNNWRGADIGPPISVLCGRLSCCGLRVTAVPHTLPPRVKKDSRGRYGATILEVFGEHGEYRRTIYAANDGGPWIFGESGEPFEFEDLAAYTAKRKRDRFTPEMLQRYLLALGLDAFRESFYLPSSAREAILLERKDPPLVRQRYEEYSLQKVREGDGLETLEAFQEKARGKISPISGLLRALPSFFRSEKRGSAGKMDGRGAQMLGHEVEVYLNRLAQGLVSVREGESWFNSLGADAQLDILRKLDCFILQAGAMESDVQNAITESGLKNTYTPCVLLSKGRLKIQMAKVLNLPADEYAKAFRLLLALFSIADSRRRSLRCKNGCTHWWHGDLMHIETEQDEVRGDLRS